MKTTIWKGFWDYEKEEKWLNEHAAKGLAMCGYSAFRYTMDECSPGEYIYRIELLEHAVNHPESLKYIRFLEENGVEHIAGFRNWIYLRKRAEDGAFELHSDLDSRIKHYRRVANLWLMLGLIEMMLCAPQVTQIPALLASIADGPLLWQINILADAVLVAFCALGFGMWWRYRRKIRKLEREREIHE